MTGIGFFAPLPLAMMLPFMAGQSMIMGDAFGKAYQYGKRKISSMSNEDFNALTVEKLGQELQADYMSLIPSLTKSIEASRDFQTMIIAELVKIVPTIPQAVIEGLSGEKNSIYQQNLDSNIQGTQDIVSSIANFFNSFATIPQAYASTTSSSGIETTQGATQLPSQPGSTNIPTNTFQNILDRNQGTAIPAPLPTAPKETATADALRRTAIAESGLSPLAYQSRETFRQNIDIATSALASFQIAYQRWKQSNTRNYITEKSYISKEAEQKKLVAKISALRIKYFQVYGHHY